MTMSHLDYLVTVVLGLLLGAIGQVLRVFVGIKKMNDESTTSPETATPFSASRLVISLVIGGGAGALAALSSLDSTEAITKAQAFAIMAAGYSGADFIEGFIKSYATPATSGPPSAAKAPEIVARLTSNLPSPE